ncbi:MAG: hypothetical protein R3E66_16350 [bacterium]
MSTTTLGCDTVALISFQERAFNTLESFGVTPLPASCEGSDGAAMLRFVMVADDATPIRPDEVVANQTVNLTRDDVTLADGKLFELPDTACSGDSCVFSEFACAAANPAYAASQNRCLRDASVDIDGAVQFDSDVTKPQVLGLLISNSGSLDGWLPQDVGNKYPDLDNDGFADPNAVNDVSLKTSRATDRPGNRKVAFNALADKFESVAKAASREDRKTLFGAWTFSGTSTAGVQSLVSKVTPTESQWTEQPGTVDRALDQIPDTFGDRRNVYQAMAEVLENSFTSEDVAGNDKMLVVFVDGNDDLRLDNFDADRVITAAQAAETKVYIVQLDSKLALEDLGGAPLLRDDPRYVENQANCNSDADCLNFEECRQPVNYSSTPGGAVESPANGTYCLPKRDDNGRLGPIQDYQRIACATEGAYIYVPASTALRSRMQWLPYALDGLWKVETVIDAFENGQVPTDQPYKVQSSFTVNLGERARTFTFSQTGDPLVGPQDDEQDTRTVIFSK